MSRHQMPPLFSENDPSELPQVRDRASVARAGCGKQQTVTSFVAAWLKCVALVIAFFSIYGALIADTPVSQAAAAGVACFFGIIARVFQAEQFH